MASDDPTGLRNTQEGADARGQQRQTQLFIETPYRNVALLQALKQSLQHHTRLAVARGLTLAGASVRSDTVKGWRAAAPETADPRLPAVFAIGR